MKKKGISIIGDLKDFGFKNGAIGSLETLKTQWIGQAYRDYGRVFDAIVQENLAGLD